MESMSTVSSLLLGIAMFFAVSYAVIYMAIIVHGILQDKDTPYSKFREKFDNL
jgi:hypothetical protein